MRIMIKWESSWKVSTVTWKEAVLNKKHFILKNCRRGQFYIKNLRGHEKKILKIQNEKFTEKE